MGDDTGWQELMHGVSDGARGIEEATAKMEEALRRFERFLERAHRNELSQDVLDGIRLGLGFSEATAWVSNAPKTLDEVRARLSLHDAEVARGELPSSAHSWRYQINDRLRALDERIGRLASGFEGCRAILERLCALRRPVAPNGSKLTGLEPHAK